MIKIYTSVVNRPDFIDLQKKCFDKFLKNKYEFIIIDDSIDEIITKNIINICINNKIKHIKTPNNLNHSNPMIACWSVLQWTYEEFIKNSNDKAIFLDSDMFLYDHFDAEEYFSSCDLSGVPQSRDFIWYLWNGLLFLNMQTIKDKNISFAPGLVRNVATDVGGNTYEYILKNPDVRVRNIIHTSHINKERNNINIIPEIVREKYKDYFCFEILMSKFLHYGSSTNWKQNWRSKEDPTKEKTEYLNYFLNTLLENK